jgi:hypothetical protein
MRFEEETLSLGQQTLLLLLLLLLLLQEKIELRFLERVQGLALSEE